MWYSIKDSPLCCGVRQFGRYRKVKPTVSNGHVFVELKGNELDNYAFGQAEFTDDPNSLEENKAAFKELCEKFHILHKTMPRRNEHHTNVQKNKVFMAIFRKRLSTDE